MHDSKVLAFPSKTQRARKQQKIKSVKNIDGIKYFNKSQIQLIRRTVRGRAHIDRNKKKVTAVKEWAVIDLITTTGVRVSEAANIRCGDLKIGYAQDEIFIRNGKGARSRTVQITKSLKTHLRSFVRWKENRGEPIDHHAFMFIGQMGPWTSQAIQNIVKKYLKMLNLYENGKSVHALRHSYAVELYRQRRDLRAVQKQLGHASNQTTQIYADVLAEDIQAQIKNIWT